MKMKYTIELTNKQKHQMDCIIDIVHRYVGFNPKLEPIKTTNIEDTNEYLIGYKTGYDIAQATKKEWGKAEYDRGLEDGKNEAIHNAELIPQLKKVEYTKGYNSAINDYNAMIQWLHDCTDDFKEFMNKKYGYDVMYLTNPKVDEGVMLYDLICDHDIAEVISEFKKWQEEKKKSDEIKIGDEVMYLPNDTKFYVIGESPNRYKGIYYAEYDKYLPIVICDFEKNECKPTGRHFDEVEQLLSKLKGVQ